MSKEERKTNISDSNNLDDADENEVLTLSELLEEQRQLDEDADAVLGGSDENFCTYQQGYVKRQALYACLSCVPESRTDASKRTGVCLACANHCHDDHELIELYTKRLFRCDCGTSKILTIRCKLDPNKMEDNDDNTYNQNFSGVYCTCHRPYPDPDEPEEAMIQCVVCEDWYHTNHLGGDTLDTSAFDEMICDTCTAKNDFLNFYSGYCVVSNNGSSADANATLDTSINIADLDTSTISTASNNDKETSGEKAQGLDAEINQCIQSIIDITRNNVEANSEEATSTTEHSGKRSADRDNTEPEETHSKRIKLLDEVPSTSRQVENECRKPRISLHKLTGASYWKYEWRTKLCRCTACAAMYTKNGVAFLLDDEDTVHVYLAKGKEKAAQAAAESTTSATIASALQAATNGVNHTVKIEAALAYNKLKQKLTEFFSTFVANEKVITAKDVTEFFDNMKKDDDK